MRATVESLGIPGSERADFVDHPPFAAARWWVDGRDCARVAAAGRDVSKPLDLVGSVVEQQLNVLEQKLPAFAGADGARLAPGGHVGRLRQHPRVSEDATPDEHAAHAA